MGFRILTVQQLGMASDKSSIRLKGNWLQRAGFHPGDKVYVHVQRGRLIVEMEENYEKEKASDSPGGAVDRSGGHYRGGTLSAV